MFLNQWLIAKTGEEILAREVFHRFKTYADFDSGVSMIELLAATPPRRPGVPKFRQRRWTAHGSYRPASGCSPTAPASWKAKSSSHSYCSCSTRTKPRSQTISSPKHFEVVESWLVRRMLVRATTKSYTQVFAELITHIRKTGRQSAGDVIEDHLAHQPGTPGTGQTTKRCGPRCERSPPTGDLSRARLRMVLEAIEDHERGWRGQSRGLAGNESPGEPTRSSTSCRDGGTPTGRCQKARLLLSATPLIDTIGNLTLLTGRLNSKVSNGPWPGGNGKRAALHGHDVLMLNRRLLEQAKDDWGDQHIRDRTEWLIDAIIGIWPVPEGHKSRRRTSNGARPARSNSQT